MLMSIFQVFLIYLGISGMWMRLEKMIYGKITPRIIDDVVALILAISLYMNFN
ncbi:hypothetical protein PQE66_gp063 [Bacillus phage PBC2]|uniref:Uncharacterized protein n=1 Tax=Bacillus phage PBC2 TaxID=1675029 RepID=A0A218KBX1_9CAUD|nr:hypothetical protein PQE66_gp063 [Bacillus phage PBC2]AKQ08378.1 hypothetical protein PBC2_063 [Bacillus phage PBC2]